jgi:murein DD-endopeptidase MepM/ murein hydrolase activator NlpD
LVGFAAVATAAGISLAVADDMHGPRISRTTADWDTVTADLQRIEGATPDALGQLNSATAAVYPNIAASSVPVLLPFNSAEFLRDRAAGNMKAAADYLITFRAPVFFQAGPGGYDAAYAVFAKDVPGLGIGFANRIDVMVSGSAFLYELDQPSGLIEWPAKELETDIPGIRKVFLESVVRYSFVRYGVPYVVSIDCKDGGPRNRKPSCRDADKIATSMLKALQVAGGAPASRSASTDIATIERPQAESTLFTYYGPGDILPGSGIKGQGGRADYTVYSKMRFPLADTPAFANSQSFMNWGDCDQTGRVSMGRQGNTPAYHCRINNVPLVADESANYAYPWRPNFCEHRYFYVGECPGGLGHQGQDIRPASCKQRMPGSNRCEPYQHDVVAARDGIILRAAGQIIFYVATNTVSERVRFRYLHLSPKLLDQDGVLSGRVVREGEVLGKVGNFLRREGATTYHLHLDLQVPTKYGWVFVNPYMTLVAAYERQIQGRGRELHDDGPTLPVANAPAAITSADTQTTAAVRQAVPPLAPTGGDKRSEMPLVPPAGDPGRSAAFQPAIKAPPTQAAANPNEKDVNSGELNRIASETARDASRDTAH